MKGKLIFLFFMSCFRSSAQQSTIHGVVSIFNSETRTGKRQFVYNAQVEDDFNKAQPALTDIIGQFKLDYVGIAGNVSVFFRVKRPGLQVVNIDALSAITGQNDVIKISMAQPDSIAEYRRQLYDIGKTQLEKRLENEIQRQKNELAILKNNSVQYTDKIKALEQELAKREEQRTQVDADAQKLTTIYASINLDDASPLFRTSFLLFKNGNLDSALLLLEQANLPIKVDSVLAGRNELIKSVAALNATDSAQRKEIEIARIRLEERVDTIEKAIHLKTDLHKIRFEFDSASACFELLLKLDPENPKKISDYAKFLEWRYQYDKAINYYLAAIKKYQQLARHSSLSYESYLADIQQDLSYIYNYKRDIPNAEIAYFEALRMKKHLAKTAPEKYEPDIAIMQFNFGNSCYDRNDLAKAEAAFSDALDIYQRLSVNHKGYDEFVAMVQSNLGKIYVKKDDFPKAEAMIFNELESRRRLAITDPKTYEPSVTLLLGNLGLLYYNHHDYTKAEATYLEELELRKHVAERDPEGYASGIANNYKNLGTVYIATKNFVKAEEAYSKALEMYKHMARSNAEWVDQYIDIIEETLAPIYTANKDLHKAEDCLIDMLSIRMKWLARSPEVYARPVSRAANRLLDLYLSVLETQSYTVSRFGQYKFDTVENTLNKISGNDLQVEQKLIAFYNILSWRLLFEFKYVKAEQSALSGLKIDPSSNQIEVNLAHALLFQGRFEEALKIYRELKVLKTDEGKSYAAICLEDLDELESKGITSNDVIKIRTFLKE